MSVSDKQIKINDLSAVLNYRSCCLGHGSWEIEIILVLNNYNFEETDVRRNAEARVCLMHILIKKIPSILVYSNAIHCSKRFHEDAGSECNGCVVVFCCVVELLVFLSIICILPICETA